MTIWFAVASVVLVLAASVTIQPEQEAFGWVLFAALVLLFAVKKVHGLFGRVLFITLGAFITLRYFLFRLFFTLQMEFSTTFVLALLLFAAECYAIGTHLLGLLLNVRPLDRPVPPLPARLPTIDVFIPTYNEDEEVAVTTAMACKRFDYPPELVNIYILDDGCRLPRLNNPQLRDALWQRHTHLKALAEQAGVTYLTREDGEQAKAGMIRAAFAGRAVASLREGPDGTLLGEGPVTTTGELLLVLDCDHIPTRDLPKTLVGHFAEPDVFLVQTPHFMLNADPLRKNIRGEERIPCESWLFYQAIMKGLDRWNGSIFCGSAALLRRSALEEVGGLCGETITEDAETALTLHSRGYRSVYTSQPLVSGLAPESIPDMLGQRARWCQGMLQIMLLKNPLFHKGLSPVQRLAYLNCCLYWLFPLFRVIFLLAPLAFLFFGLNIYNASTEQVLVFAAPHLLASILLANYLYPRLRPFPMDDILEIFQTFFLLPAIVAVCLSPRKPVFKTTRKGVQLEDDAPSLYALPLLAVLGLMTAGLVAGVNTWQSNPFLREALVITLGWNLLNILFVLCTLGGMFERRQRRTAHRFAVNEPARLDGVSGTLRNLSGKGFQLTLDGPCPAEGQDCDLASGAFAGPVHIVRVEGNRVSGTFVPSADVVDFVYGDSARWQRRMDTVLESEGPFGTLVLVRLCLVSAFQMIRETIRRVFAPFWLILAVGLLAPSVAEADPLSLSVADLVRQEQYVLNEAKGVVRIPVHLSRRRTTDNVILDLRYTTPAASGPSHPDITLNVDGTVRAGRVSRLSETDYQIRFVAPEDKLGPGDRTFTVTMQQAPSENGEPLWTNIDLRNSTITIDAELNPLAEDRNLDTLFDPLAAGAIPVHVVLGKLDEAHLLRAIRAVQTLALLLKNRPLEVSVGFSPVEDRDNLLISDSMDDAPLLTQDRTFALLRESELTAVRPPMPQSVLQRGATRSFKDFGLDTLLFRPGHTLRNTAFVISSETRLTPNRTLTLSLDVAYSAGLAEDARLEVHMNGAPLTWIPLRDPAGAHYSKYTVSVPTSRLQKGLNTLGLVPRLRPASGAAAETPLFAAVLNTSSLSLPDTGVYVRLPELGTLLTDGYPFKGNSSTYLVQPSPVTAAALLNVAALIAQRRGSIGQNLTLHFGQWTGENRYAYVFDVDPDLPANTFLMQETFIVPADQTIALRLSAPDEDALLQGTLRLWEPTVQALVRGESVSLNLGTGEVSPQEGETLIISDAWPFPQLSFYSNNHPQATRVAAVFVILGFATLAWALLRRQRP